MNRQQQIEECQRQLAEVQEKLERLKREQKQYVIPFKFENFCGTCDSDWLGIPFNDNKQVLYYEGSNKIWKVRCCNNDDLITCSLADEPTPIGELKVGYTYFELLNVQKLENVIGQKCRYLKCLRDKKAYVTNDSGVLVDQISTRATYYQVIPVEG